jgi:methyltransferase (TIGR00027 family)
MADASQPDNTAVRVALWRALHLELDEAPHVFVDDLALQLAAPEPGWQRRRDMDPRWTSRNRASIVGRARFVEELLADTHAGGVTQYVVLGAGLDTFAQRHHLAAAMQVFEIDEPATQTWKQQRLTELGVATPASVHFVPVDFEAGERWADRLVDAGFDLAAPVVVASTGVAVYLTLDAITATMRTVAGFAAGSTLVMSFMIPIADVDTDEQSSLHGAERGARAGGTPWISFFTPDQMVAMAMEAGFAHARHVAPVEIEERWFGGRADGLRPSSAEHLLVATT